MLIGIDPLLSPELLHTLRAMGHGDEIAIVDANYPGASCTDQLIRLDGINATDVLRAVLTVMPLDTFVDDPAMSMQSVTQPNEIPPAVQEFQKTIDEVADNPRPIKQIERFAFYERAKQSFAIIQTGEGRLYGNIILKKGVLPLS